MNVLDIMTFVDPIAACLLFWFVIFSYQFEKWTRFARIGFAVASAGLMYQGWALFMGFDRPNAPASTFWFLKDIGLSIIGITFAVIWAKKKFIVTPIIKEPVKRTPVKTTARKTAIKPVKRITK